MRRGTDLVLLNHDGLHARACDFQGVTADLRRQLLTYAADNCKRRNERLVLRIRHDLKVLGMLEASKMAVEKALQELSDFASSENLPRLNEVAERVYDERQRVLAELRVTTTSQPGLRTVPVPSPGAGTAVIEIPEITMESLRTTVMTPSR